MPTDPKARLRRKAAAEALTEAGLPVTASTLATKATRGGGPPFELFGRIPIYTWGPTLAWAESRLTAPRDSTSAADVLAARKSRVRNRRAATLRASRGMSCDLQKNAAPPPP
ncbi:MAG: hypothetical protein QOD74_1177 [Variibacter sp.]|jgi:hypothetical protein|nr:hypothetical protein [Variibacter sp.]